MEGRFNWPKLCAGIGAALAAAACTLPAVSANISAAVFRGEPWHAASGYIISILLAAIAAIVLRYALRDKDFSMVITALLVLVITVSFNLLNAMGSAGTARTAFSDPRTALQAKVQGLNRELQFSAEQAARFAAIVGSKTAGMIDAEIAQLEADTRYARSGQCTNVTLSDSQKLCGGIAELKAKREAAASYEAAEKRRKGLADELAAIGSAPAVADVQVDNIAKVMRFFVSVDSALNIGLLLDWQKAICFEAFAVLGPSLLVYLFGLLGTAKRPEDEPVKLADEAPPEPEAASKPPANDSLEAFISSQIVPKRGGRLSATPVDTAYRTWCKLQGVEPAGKRALGDALKARFRFDTKRGTSYLGVGLRSGKPQLSVVGQ